MLDSCFMQETASKAVRNRRRLLADELVAAVHERRAAGDTGPMNVMVLASGPASEVFDAFERLDDPGAMNVTLVDIDLQALAFVADKIKAARLSKHITPVNGNLLYLALGRQKLELPPQHFIYSMGLVDYLQDKFARRVLDYGHSMLAPGGRLIVGNFHPRNDSRGMMDYILDWPLVYRTEDDMNRLYQASAFAAPCTRILFEDERVNLFAEGIKPPSE